MDSTTKAPIYIRTNYIVVVTLYEYMTEYGSFWPMMR
jgi:hypothetical protein